MHLCHLIKSLLDNLGRPRIIWLSVHWMQTLPYMVNTSLNEQCAHKPVQTIKQTRYLPNYTSKHRLRHTDKQNTYIPAQANKQYPTIHKQNRQKHAQPNILKTPNPTQNQPQHRPNHRQWPVCPHHTACKPHTLAPVPMYHYIEHTPCKCTARSLLIRVS